MCLFEMRPDLFPAATMTDLERGLWRHFYEELEADREQKKKHG